MAEIIEVEVAVNAPGHVTERDVFVEAVGEIAKILGCWAIGIAGSENKVAQCLEVFGYDAAID